MRQSWLTPLAVTGAAGSKGMGIFAVEAIPSGTTVAGFGGHVVDRAELHALDEDVRIHALQIDGDLFLASVPPFDDADYVNHSCEPNCGIVGSVLLVTMRDVAAGEELCFDYAMTDIDDYDEFACSCGTASCRWIVSGADWKDPELSSGTATGVGSRRTSSVGSPERRSSGREHAVPSAAMDPRERFVAAVNLPAAEVPLDVAALCIAAHAHPGLDVDAWCARLDELAARCPAPDFDALRVHLFEREGFAGNLDHYEDPENSLLDSVIERRRGIPITLSVLMIAVGRRLGIDVQGVGMPGHFLVLDGLRGDVWCDPFHGGARLDPAGCRRRFDLVYGGAMTFLPDFLAPTPTHAIVARMLANLERGKLATDPVQRAWMCALHLDIPGITFDERMQLADQLAATGDVMRAATEFDRLAGVADSDVADRLRTRARALRAGMN